MWAVLNPPWKCSWRNIMRPPLRIALALLTFLSCSAGCARSPTLLKPGDRIGSMVLTTDQTGVRGGADFCPNNTYVSAGETRARPALATVDCHTPVPSATRLFIGDGWFTKDDQQRESNWKALTWELYIDGHQVDL